MKPVRFIHTSDIHLDTSFSGSEIPSRLGDRKREAIRGTLRRILEDAALGEAGLVLIAGDLFESDRVTPDTCEFLKQQFETAAGVRIFIAPGNHDPFAKGSPYREDSWPGNVHIFDAEEWRSVDLPELGVRVTGFGFRHNYLETRPFLRLPPLPGDRVNIVMAHASDLGSVPAGKSKHAPFTAAEIAGKNVQYCALGHYHEQRRVENPGDGALIWYSGIPEGRGWDEAGPRGYLIGEIDDGGVRVEGRVSSRFDWNTLEIACDEFSTREQVLDAVTRHRGAGYGAETLLRVRLVGALDPRLDLSLQELGERLAGECLLLQWDDATHPAIDFDQVAGEKTLRGRFVRLMNERIASAGAGEREVLERARLYGVEALGGREVRLR
jgi:DNA repair exonuclease SbcCD nuclease subunit